MPSIETLILLLVAALNAYTAFKSHRTAATTADTNVTMHAAAENIAKVEVATNSMKDALVVATGQAAHAAGVEQGRADVIGMKIGEGLSLDQLKQP